MREERDNLSAKLAYFLIGGGIGAVIALLFAPKAGRELRGEIADVTRRGVDLANEKAHALGNRASEVYHTGRDKAAEIYDIGREKTSDLLETGKGVISEQKDRVSAAIEAGKKAYQDKKSEGLAIAAGEGGEQS